jgi:hypothetical protein
MVRSAVSKVMWVGRATVFLVGLAVILAMVMGVASAAFGANGGNFILGNPNVATAITKLTMQGTANGSALQVTQQSTGNGASGVGVTVPAGKAPIKVNAAAGKATNLDADKLDGKDAPLWAVINLDGTIDRGFGVTSTEGPGGNSLFVIDFNRNVSNCAHVASLGDGTGNTFQGEVSASGNNHGLEDNQVVVTTFNSIGESADKPFHLAVFC